MKLVIIIQDPFQDNTLTFPRYVEAACQQHELLMVFFQFDAVFTAVSQPLSIAKQAWIDLYTTYTTPLMVCQGSLESRQIPAHQLLTGFTMGSYGTLVTQMDQASRIITFGSGG